MKTKSAILMVVSFFLCINLWAQEKTITGKITAVEDGSPLPGVTVRATNDKTRGAVSDMDGKYSIKVGADVSSLTFSFVGFESKTVQIGTSTNIDVQLGVNAQDLNEVVVTANAIKKEKKEIGYAITTVGGEETTKARDANVLNTLAGKVAGVQITSQSGSLGGGSKILIRGASSLSGDNQPLFVVDGNPISNSGFNGTRSDIISGGVDVGNLAADINPDDIESMTVLKGAAATVQYGSRGKNGAIIITTKSGRGLKGKGKTSSVSVNSSVRFDNPLRLPDYQNEYAQGDQGVYNKDNYVNGWGPKIEGQRVADWKGDTVNLQAQPDNVKDFYETGATYINSVSFSQGDENSDFRFGYTNLKQNGIVPNSTLDKNTFAINTSRQVTDKLNVQVTGNYINLKTFGNPRQGGNNPSTTIGLVNGLPRTYNIKDLEENLVDEFGNPYGLDGNRTVNNPYWVTAYNTTQNKRDRFYGNVTFNYKFNEKWNALYRLNTDFSNEERMNVMRKQTLGRNNGEYDRWDITNHQLTSDLMLTYSDQLNEDIGFTGIAGHNLNQRKFGSTRITGTDLIAQDLYTFANARSISNVSDSEIRRLYAVFADLTFDYQDFLFLTLTGRNDWSSTLPIDNQSYFYPGVSTSFIFSDLMGPESKKILRSGKLRMNYAQVGSDENPYRLNFFFAPLAEYFTQYTGNNLYPQNGLPAYAATNTIPNANLKPQLTNNFEIGTELVFLGGRLYADFSFYDKRTKDQIVQLSLPQSTGFNFVTTNIGEIQNKGIELLLSGSPIELDNGFKWTASINYTKNTQKVLDLGSDLDEYVLTSGFSGVQIKAAPGEEFGLYGPGYERDPDGNIVIDENTGLRTIGETKRLGDIYPDWSMGVNNEFAYKGFTFSFLVDMRKGGVIFSSTTQDLRFSGLAEETLENREADFVDQGVNKILDGSGNVVGYKPNTTEVSAQDYWQQLGNNGLAEPSTYAADFVKLREVRLGYTLPEKWISKSPFASVQIALEGRNLWLIDSAVPHIDPEVNFFGTSLTGQGVEFSSVPSTRTIGFNLRVTL